MNPYIANIKLNDNIYKVYNNLTDADLKKTIKKFMGSECCDVETYIYIDNRPGHEKIEVKKS